MQLEWRALAKGLREQATPPREAILDALIFRGYRRSLYPDAAREERELEINEGLAEYTGYRMSGRGGREQTDSVAKRLETNATTNPTLTRSFAYASGPAYGLLLDSTTPDWRKGLKPETDLGTLLQEGLKIKLPLDLKGEAEFRAGTYNGNALIATETRRENDRQTRLSDCRARFLDGPIVIVPLSANVNYSYDPTNLEAVDGVGTYYPTLTVSDEWGVLNVRNGAMMIREGERPARVHLSAAALEQSDRLRGIGWELSLTPGWALVPSYREGNFELQRRD
jgi:hypothetical protein